MNHTFSIWASNEDLGVGSEQRSGVASIVEQIRRTTTAQQTGSKPRNAYRQIAPVRAAISRKANAVASLPLMVSTSDDRLIESGPLIDIIDRPNPGMASREFWQATVAWLNLTGACHWLLTLLNNVVIEIVPVGAWQMKPVIVQGRLTGWKYRPRGFAWNQAIDIGLDEVWTISEDTFDPDDAFGFSSPLEAAGLAVAQLWKADLANAASLDNGVEPGGAFTMPGNPTPEQIVDMRRQIDERQAGVNNRRRPLLLHGGMDWKPIAASFDEMEFSTLQKMKIVDTCVALEVDPAAIGYYENSNYAHAESAKAGFWIDTILPLTERLASEFQRAVTNRIADRSRATWSIRTMSHVQKACAGFRAARQRSRNSLYPWFDSSRVPAIRRAQLERSKEGAIWIQTFKATPEDVIEALDLPLEVHPWQRQAWQNMSEMPVGDALPGATDPNGDEPLISGDLLVPEVPAAEQVLSSVVKNAPDEQARERLWQNWRASWAGLERAAQTKISRHWYELRRETLQRLDEVMGSSKAMADERRDSTLIARILFDLQVANDRLIRLVGPIIERTVQLGGQQSMDEAAAAAGKPVDDADPFRIRDPRVQQAIRVRKIRLANTNQTVRRRVAEELAAGFDAKESGTELADRIRKEFGFATTRSTTIARTEIGAAMEEARQLGRTQAGVPRKSWLWSRKEKGRENHAATEEATMDAPIPNDAPFRIAGSNVQAMAPRLSGVPEEDINCACTTLARFDDGAKDARLWDHITTHGFTTPADITRRAAPKERP